MAATKSKSKTAAKKATKKNAAASKKAAAAKARPAVASKSKPAAKGKAAVKAKATKSKAAAKSQAPKAARAKASKAAKKSQTPKDVLDFGEFPAGSVTRHEVTLCLSCIYKLFTNQLGLAPRTAYNEIRRYAPTVEELTARAPARPFFKPSGEKSPRCPYCDAPKRWHAALRVHRVEGKAADAARRALVKRLPTKEEQFLINEEKKTARQVFFEWLERLGQTLDFEDDAAWMLA
ncbi:MAG TPA: hypothetical protein VF508_04255, partial [Pyrinomonadaceae bacterium]